MSDFDINAIEKIITYYDGTGKWSCKFIFNTLNEDGRVKEVVLPEKEAYPYLKKYLEEVKHYTPVALEDGTIDNDPTFALNKNLDQMVEETHNAKVAIHAKLKKEKEPRKQVKNLKSFKNRLLALGLGFALGATAIAGGTFAWLHGKNKDKQIENNEIDNNDDDVITVDANTFWDTIVAKASSAQQQFLSAAVKTLSIFNQQFANNHYEQNVVFPDGHIEEIVQFGISPEEFASAYILGANFTPEEYMAFMNDSNISLLEYTKHWQQWLTQMTHAYIVKDSQEDVGILNYVTDEAGINYITQVNSLHTALRSAKERGDVEAQKTYLNALYQIFMQSYKMEEAAQLDPTYENFVSLDLPDYVLVAKPIFDSVAEEYRNEIMEDGNHFYDALYEKNFVDGIYCHIYEWTMQANIAAQEARLSQVSYQADESYADYDELIRAIRENARENGWLKDSENKNRYKVEYLSEVLHDLENDLLVDDSNNHSQEDVEIVYDNGGSSSNQGQEQLTSTHTETKKKKKKKKEKVTKQDLTPDEKEEAEKQEQQIQEEIQQENDQNQSEAEQQADQQVQQDQSQEDQKKQELDQQVQEENQHTQDQINDGNIPDNATPSQTVDGNAVKDPTTDGTGAVDPSTPLPDPEDYYNSTHSETQAPETASQETQAPAPETQAAQEVTEATSSQSGGTITEGDIPIDYYYEETPAETTAETAAEVPVYDVTEAAIEPMAAVGEVAVYDVPEVVAETTPVVETAQPEEVAVVEETQAPVEAVPAPTSIEPEAAVVEATPVAEVASQPVETVVVEETPAPIAVVEATEPVQYTPEYFEISDEQKAAIVAMMNEQMATEIVEEMAQPEQAEAETGPVLQK